jgi:head-tail adaptor
MSEFAGALRERITLERRIGTRDAIAGAVGLYDYDGAAWAAITPTTPAGVVAGDVISSLLRWQVIMRKREGVDLRTRLVWRGKYLAVRRVICDPATPGQMVLTCAEVR